MVGITKTNYNEYMYYFKLEVADLTQFQYAMLTIVGTIFLTIGVMVYSIWLKHYETRTLLTITLMVQVVGSLFNIAFTRQWYLKLGISAFTFIFFTSSTMFPLVVGFYMIPPFVLIAKLSPAHVEATIFSFSASVINLCIFMIPRMMGNLWNKILFDVSSDNLDELWKLYCIEVVSILICLFYVRLIPTWEEVSHVQDDIKRLNLDAQTPATAGLRHGIQDSGSDEEAEQDTNNRPSEAARD